MRLFLAIPFSPEIRGALAEAQDQLRRQGVQANFTRPENLHLTLAFLGETDRQAAVQQVMAGIGQPAFSLTVGGSGHFGDLYWAGVRRDPALLALASSLQDALRAAGFALDRRPFRPHITLARQVQAPQPPALTVPARTMPVREIVLFRSDRPGGRLTYTPLFRQKLQ